MSSGSSPGYLAFSPKGPPESRSADAGSPISEADAQRRKKKWGGWKEKQVDGEIIHEGRCHGEHVVLTPKGEPALKAPEETVKGHRNKAMGGMKKKKCV